MPKKVLVTGAAGMMGSRLIKHLLKETDYVIYGIDNLLGGYLENLPSPSEYDYGRFEFMRWDIAKEELGGMFEHYKFDVVYHTAAYAAEGLSPFIRKFNYINNVVGTANITNNCIEYGCKLVFFSSIAIYGNGWGSKEGFREHTIPKPIDPYGIAKYTSEMDIQVAGDQHGLDWDIVRPFNLYGPSQNIWDPYRNVIGIWMYNALNGKPLQIYGDGNQVRNFTFVDDIMPALTFLGDTKGSPTICNLGSDKSYTINQLADVFKKVVFDCKIEYLPERHEVREAVANVEKIRDLIPTLTPLEEGIAKMWEWAKIQPRRERKAMKTEIKKGLYEHWK